MRGIYMGGRGQSSMTFFDNKKPQNNALSLKPPETLKEAIGRQGSPKSIIDAYKNANPYYSKNYFEYSFNCQRAVVAYELRRRGYDVIAQETFYSDKLPNIAHIYKSGENNAYWMGSFKNAKSAAVGAKTSKNTVKNIEDSLLPHGNGTRAIIRVVWKNGNGAHVFNAEVFNGKVRYIDAQTGHTRDIIGTLNNSIASKTQMVRTDNLQISERAKKAVRRTR